MTIMNFDWHTRYQQQAQWTKSIRLYLYERCKLRSARIVLEVGCGTGVLLAELADYSALRVHGLDLDIDALRQAERHAPGAHLTRGDAHVLPYSAGMFDVTLCHFLLLWLGDAQRALAEMRRVTRRGGFVLALAEPDYGGRIDYPDALRPLGEAQRESLRRQGADPLLGRRLGMLLHTAGLQDVEVGVLGGQWSEPPPQAERDSEWRVLEQDLQDFIPRAMLRKLRQADAAAWVSGERILFVPTFYGWGRVP
jgi:SAM-dependent methyltransferase